MPTTTEISQLATVIFIVASVPFVAHADSPETGPSEGLRKLSRLARAHQASADFETRERVALDKAFMANRWVPTHTTWIRGQPSAPLKALIEEAFPTERQRHRPFGLAVERRAPVAAFVEFWTTRGRATLAHALSKMGRYENMIRTILDEEGVPQDLIYLCLVESGFTPRALSRANAVGLWQFIPATAVNYGLRIDGEVDERRDPIKATRAAARYLRALHERLGSWPLAMAGYNAGSGTVLSGLSRTRANSYWNLAARDALPRNTRNYVAKILAVALIAENREAFGVKGVRPARAMEFEEITVDGGTPLAPLAEAAGAELSTLKRLNPELLLPRTPGRVSTYRLRVPRGSSAVLARSSRKDKEGFGRYPLRVGETLSDVANGFGIPEHVLREANGLAADTRVPYGTVVHVPKHSGDLPPLPRTPTEPVVVLLPDVRFDYGDKQRVFYQVKPGDTATEIAAHFGVRTPELAMWNDLTRDELTPRSWLQLYLDASDRLDGVIVLAESQVRCVYDGSTEYDIEYDRRFKKRWAGTARGGGRTYRVRRGESLRTIARKHGVSTEQLKRWNNLRGRRLRPGYRLVIYPSRASSKTRVATTPNRRRARPASTSRARTTTSRPIRSARRNRRGSSGVRYKLR